MLRFFEWSCVLIIGVLSLTGMGFIGELLDGNRIMDMEKWDCTDGYMRM